jgi:hypothetical protein
MQSVDNCGNTQAAVVCMQEDRALTSTLVRIVRMQQHVLHNFNHRNQSSIHYNREFRSFFEYYS